MEREQRRIADSALAPINSFLEYVGELCILLADTFKRLFTNRLEVKEMLGQMAFIGVATVPLIALVNFFSGAVIALYFTGFLMRFGGENFVGGTVALSMTREIAPVLSALMVAARCGSAMAALVGQMKVTEQIDALRMLSVNPVNYLVVPRVIAAVTMLPVLTLIGMYSGVIGGYLVAVSGGVSPGAFTASIQQYLTSWDFVGGLLKTPFFGLIIVAVACHQGFRATNGAVGVGKATTHAVVISMVLCYIANYLLANLFFGLR